MTDASVKAVAPEPIQLARASAAFDGRTLIAALALLVLLLGAVAALFPSLLATFPPLETDIRAAMQPPGPQHWFGTDELGRDLYSRVVHGARYSLLVGVGSTLVAATVGLIIGLISAASPGIIDTALMRVTDLILAFPTLLFALVVVAMLGPGPLNVMWSIAFASVPLYAKLVRTEIRLVRSSEYVEAIRLLGIGRTRLLLRHVLPNALAPLLVVLTTGVGSSMITGAGLSFLGMGATPPDPEWGLMLSNARNYVEHGWWLVVFPGIAITATVIAFTVLGRSLRDRRAGGQS